jgi:RNA polymerase sigma-70 factor (ECF subfamily)
MEACALEFQKIYDTYQPKILRYLTRMVGESDAEDLTQDVFVKVNKALGDFRGESKVSTWLYRIATNVAMDRMRSPSIKRTVQASSSGLDVEEGGGEVVDQNAWTGEKTPLVEHQVFGREMNDCIQDYIDNLPKDYRIVLLLSEFEGQSNGEIANILGVPLGVVKIRLHRARERLKQQFLQTCDPCWIEENEFIPELKIV